MAAVLAIELGEIAILLLLARLALGWTAPVRWGGLLAVLLLGTLTFGSLGMLAAGTLRAEATLAVVNGLYALFLALGGILFAVDLLPQALQATAELLPQRHWPNS